MSEEKELILVADDDEDIVRFVEVNLRLEGFEVQTVSDGEKALHAAYDLMPDLVLLDVMMPKLDGFEVCQRLRSDSRTKHLSVIMLTAKSLSADKVVGLTAGADDYMIKPFDPIELVARVKSALRRSKTMRGLNPLTQLPGNIEVQEQVSKRVEAEEPFAILYIDLDNFKAFNDYYGFLRGDEVIKLLSQCAGQSLEAHGTMGSFIGHIGGDDFIAIVHPDVAEPMAKDLIERWDKAILSLYDPEDAAQGFIEVLDRKGNLHRYPLTTISIGIANNTIRPIGSHWEASEIAAEMKQFSKREARSSYAVDRRRGDDEAPTPRTESGARTNS
jgi:diguanylate cyclase (GGDEF)-like protein